MIATPPLGPPFPQGPIKFPDDQYLHPFAPTEWWWHTGTLRASTPSGELTFGFEINAASFGESLFTQVMLTDVAGKAHYAQNASHKYSPLWAQSDVKQDWYVSQGYPNLATPPDPAAGYVFMTAPKADPTKNMSVKARLIDQGAVVTFDLMLS